MGKTFKVVRPNFEEQKKEDDVSKEDRIINYIKSIASIDDCMQPFKEQKRDLKTNYVENGWLDKQEIKLALKAYRMTQG